jgi:hypothetical protein
VYWGADATAWFHDRWFCQRWGQATSNCQIKKLQRKVKFLQRKETGGGTTNAGFKPRDKDTDDYIRKEVLDAVRKASGDKGVKYVNYLLSGVKKSAPDKHFTKGVKRNAEEEEDDTQVDEDAAGDEEALDASALASFGHSASNWHPQNPNKHRHPLVAVLAIGTRKTPIRNCAK